MQKILKWEVIYKVEPTLSRSELFQGYNFEVNGSITILKRLYHIPVTLDARRIESKTILLKFPNNEISNDLQEVRKFLLKRMMFTKDFSKINITYDSPTLVNKETLQAEGFETRTSVRSVCVMPYSLLDVDSDSFASSEQFWQSGFNGEITVLEDSILFISEWIEKSVAEPKAINSFMLLWVAFNCLYETFTTVVNPMGRKTHAIHRIDKTLHSLLPSGEIRGIVNSKNQNINKLISYELPVADREILNGVTIDSDTERMLVAMGHIYKVRNLLFHKGSLQNEIEHQSETARDILLPIITASLRNLVNY